MTRQYIRGTPEQRFWPKVHKTDGCWEWTANRNKKGYGLFNVGGKMVSTHRFAYELASGPIPDGMMICHHCDNPACVRHDHLFLGTNSDNMRDAYAKGRIKPPAMGRVENFAGRRGGGVLGSRYPRHTCKRGHEMTGDNVVTWNRGTRGGVRRRCRQCLQSWKAGRKPPPQ